MKFVIALSIALAFLVVASASPVKKKVIGPPIKAQPPPPDPQEKDAEESVAPAPAPKEPTEDKEQEESEEEEPAPAPKQPIENKDKDKEGKEEPKGDKERDQEEEDEENPDLFEGDLKLSEEDIKKLLGNPSDGQKRDAVCCANRRWPGGIVPYVLDKTFDIRRQGVLASAINEFNKKTCVRFVPRKKYQRNYVRFIVGGSCYSTKVGKSTEEEPQTISIGQTCNYIGTVIHEMMHAIGFFHEQSRLDRDSFIRIFWGNIEKDREHNFQKYGHGEADSLGENFDYGSVMHYHRTAFGVKGTNGRPLVTIVAKGSPQRQLGQRRGFSPIDLKQINKLYNCTKFLQN